MTDFAALLKNLVAAGVEFVLVGGAAATAHGSSRLTQDLDIVYSRSPANLARLVKALAPIAPYLRDALPVCRFDGTSRPSSAASTSRSRRALVIWTFWAKSSGVALMNI